MADARSQKPRVARLARGRPRLPIRRPDHPTPVSTGTRPGHVARVRPARLSAATMPVPEGAANRQGASEAPTSAPQERGPNARRELAGASAPDNHPAGRGEACSPRASRSNAPTTDDPPASPGGPAPLATANGLRRRPPAPASRQLARRARCEPSLTRPSAASGHRRHRRLPTSEPTPPGTRNNSMAPHPLGPRPDPSAIRTRPLRRARGAPLATRLRRTDAVRPRTHRRTPAPLIGGTSRGRHRKERSPQADPPPRNRPAGTASTRPLPEYRIPPSNAITPPRHADSGAPSTRPSPHRLARAASGIRNGRSPRRSPCNGEKPHASGRRSGKARELRWSNGEGAVLPARLGRPNRSSNARYGPRNGGKQRYRCTRGAFKRGSCGTDL